MTSVSLPAARLTPRQLLAGIGTTGLVAGALDITAACLKYTLLTHKNPLGVLRFVASGAVGPAALTGGLASALGGLLLHFLIAFSWTTLYFGLYPRVAALRRRPAAAGLLYGVVVWLVMNLGVVPLSQVPRRPFNPVSAATEMGILMLCIGLPIGLLTARLHAAQPAAIR
ncbi:hypothetical protein [Hymenobacter chitinivorans]|uniref:DUF1440 domain-containing protein n=1 Tax=Hymenobacter chitinivorans DSM 11115 TaxID=1121954 RepID=A0A2M9BPI2_9BACT|nr:hypothetical protein [Hymenobacter chitinivorans]PJJ59866.1 hypothetical protein CLV45_1288 [Hymenobacter chitinivorans DSM 11115]